MVSLLSPCWLTIVTTLFLLLSLALPTASQNVSTASSSTPVINDAVPVVNVSASSNDTMSSSRIATFSPPFQVILADTSHLPLYDWTLANSSVPEDLRTSICQQQIDFCQKAGCTDATAKLTNFCETKYMGVACFCSHGDARLQQYQWPVMLSDCRFRNTACKDACIKPNSGTSDRNMCISACNDQFGNNCGNPGQNAANYAVAKVGDKPNYRIVQGGNAQNSAVSLSTSFSSSLFLSLCVATVLVIL